MADVFISYTRQDREWASSLANVLEQEGLSTWWDDRLIPGQFFDEKIEEELLNSKCVLVIWSALSVKSNWVKSEAHIGLEKKNLIPVCIDKVEKPIPYRLIQTIDLSTWDRVSIDSNVTSLIIGVRAILDTGSNEKLLRNPILQKKVRRKVIRSISGSLLAIVALVTLVFSVLFLKNNFLPKVEDHNSEHLSLDGEEIPYLVEEQTKETFNTIKYSSSTLDSLLIQKGIKKKILNPTYSITFSHSGEILKRSESRYIYSGGYISVFINGFFCSVLETIPFVLDRGSGQETAVARRVEAEINTFVNKNAFIIFEEVSSCLDSKAD